MQLQLPLRFLLPFSPLVFSLAVQEMLQIADGIDFPFRLVLPAYGSLRSYYSILHLYRIYAHICVYREKERGITAEQQHQFWVLS
jgi:hypothetical protein